MANEPIQGGPYPEPIDPPDGPGQMSAIVGWAAGRSVMRFASIAARDAALPAPVDGMVCYIAADNGYYARVGGQWICLFMPWTSYTPVLTASPTTPVLGSGGSITGQWAIFGGTVYVKTAIQFGSSGVSAGSGAYLISLPRAAAVTSMAGSARLRDSSASNLNAIASVLVSASSSEAVLSPSGFGGNLTHANPWSWGANDSIHLEAAYAADL